MNDCLAQTGASSTGLLIASIVLLVLGIALAVAVGRKRGGRAAGVTTVLLLSAVFVTLGMGTAPAAQAADCTDLSEEMPTPTPTSTPTAVPCPEGTVDNGQGVCEEPIQCGPNSELVDGECVCLEGYMMVDGICIRADASTPPDTRREWFETIGSVLSV